MPCTEVESWTINDLLDAFKQQPLKKKKIIIPQYQRNLVWNNSKKKLLIDSIKSGMPIGAFLLFNEGAEDGNIRYHLVDGLQRSTSIKNYNENPTLFFSPDNIDKNFRNILVETFKDDEKKLVKLFVEWVQTLKGFNENDGFSSYSAITYIDEKTDNKLDKNQTKLATNSIITYLDEIKQLSNINDIKVPIIIYHGNKSDLPTIFERINSKGTQLNKYQIYAATWSIYDSFDINNTEIIKKIQAKYEALIEEGLEIDNYDPLNFNTASFNYFEYLFGLGKLLCEDENYSNLFGKNNNKKDQTESIGFNLGCICLGNDLKKMGKLPTYLQKIDLNKYEKCILDSVKITNKILNPFIGFKANTKSKGNPVIYHTEMQIISIIGKIFKSKYDENLNLRNGYSQSIDKLKRTIPLHYLYDILRNYWSGTGDNKALELIKSDKYKTEIKQSQWDLVFDEWFENDISKKEKSRITIKPQSILLLRFIYTHLFSAHEELSHEIYEIEHLCPVSKLKNAAKNVDGLPISCISNLCLIEKDLNRSKNNKTIYQYYDERKTEGEFTEKQIKEEIEHIESRTFTQRTDLEFMNDFKDDSIQDYYNFLEKRFYIIKDKFYKLNKIVND
ncbi:DUF262 domain-containing protein [Vallitalea guaymasensis]|uniref:DUF262 domain-containing protein n=1 Tax=Vallitalea guaymasensis TaxID=1185412 RepID=A0A8J8SBG4_9FIRM|nr:DUF262 domain-containing protein [Vallitalea guaymasensis]QUH28301.1 DUF262 domain-containing protein [Vallitalea guaymasensis]